MKIIITGATGSAGANLTRYLVDRGHTVIATGKTANPPKLLLQQVGNYIQADITRPHSLPAADVCIHTAAYSDDKAKLQDLLLTNETGTKHVMEAARDCEKFIHISSSSVYLPEENPISEAIAGKQNNKLLSPYGLSKLKAETAVIENNHFSSCYILRPRAHYGIGDKMIFPRILKLENGGKLRLPGSMQVRISMTHFNNLGHAVECCINSSKTGLNTYNVSDDETYVFFDVIQQLTTDIYGRRLSVNRIPVILLRLMALFKINGITPLLVRSFTKNMVLNIDKIKNELNYQPVHCFKAALPEINEWVHKIGGPEVLKKAEKHLAWKV